MTVTKSESEIVSYRVDSSGAIIATVHIYLVEDGENVGVIRKDITVNNATKAEKASLEQVGVKAAALADKR